MRKPGSLWRRWDPHIHAPGTIFNDQFKGDDPWNEYLDNLEKSAPLIEAIGVTDYFSFDCYEKVCEQKKDGRLSNVGLVFPNVEMRFGVGTEKGAPVNFHLLISPDDPDHVAKAKRFLEGLTFKYGVETYRCRKADLVLLGKAHSGKEIDDVSALREGANQFKIDVDKFIELWNDTLWIRENSLIAVAASSKDGSAGLQKDASLSALRTKIERLSHMIFSSQPKQREFWLGKGAASVDEIINIYGGLRPCVHGSDAHDPDKVGQPDKERYCWVKGDLCFDTLRQACMEPELRVMIGEEKPEGAFASQIIDSVTVTDADWFGSDSVVLNSGLVGIVGARGSGKTALADVIASGSFALPGHINDKSFIQRAKEHLVGSKAILHWQDGSESKNNLGESDVNSIFETPRIQYLSQQFVEQLCSSEGATDELVKEIERVVFSSHSKEERLGAEDFRELLDLTAARGRESRKRNEDAIANVAEKLIILREKQEGLGALEARKKELEGTVKKDTSDRVKLVPKSAKKHAAEFERVSKAADAIREKIEIAKRKRQSLDLLGDHVDDYRARISIEELDELKDAYPDTGFDLEEWSEFKTDFVGKVQEIIEKNSKATTKKIAELEGINETADAGDDVVSENSLLPEGEDITKLPLSLLEKEEARLTRLIGADKDKQRRHTVLTEKIRATNIQINKTNEQITSAKQAKDTIKELMESRLKYYEGVFDGIVSEEESLRQLYKPLSDQLDNASGALGKLSFSIKRMVDIEAWSRKGELLIDTRKAGDFKGRGSLYAAAENTLDEHWCAGTAKDVAEAMSRFRDAYNDSIIAGAKADRRNKKEWHEWGAQASKWLFDTSHIRISYGIQYDGVEIETLSPGTRGIMLLLLYLAIDKEDVRPLIIDQPEENLDPKSIYDELVGLFRQAKQRRQIIIVTHNANLIVNTDADQVIVAESGRVVQGKLPEISYISGALEDPVIRSNVCNILEGGEQAFKERAKRLRVNIS